MADGKSEGLQLFEKLIEHNKKYPAGVVMSRSVVMKFAETGVELSKRLLKAANDEGWHEDIMTEVTFIASKFDEMLADEIALRTTFTSYGLEY